MTLDVDRIEHFLQLLERKRPDFLEDVGLLRAMTAGQLIDVLCGTINARNAEQTQIAASVSVTPHDALAMPADRFIRSLRIIVRVAVRRASQNPPHEEV